MTIPLWCLVAFVLWTIALVSALSVARFRHLATGGSHRDFGVPDDRRLIWRLFRAHLNCLENLPLFAAVVLIGAVRGVSGPALNVLSIVYVVARFGQSSVHVLGGPSNARFALLVLQLLVLVALTFLVVMPL